MHGVGLGGLVFIVFLVLKLTGVITWAWIWVFAPLWIPAAIAVVAIGLFILAGFVYKKLVKK